MLKKTTNFVLIFTLAITLFACGKYRVERPGMPEALKTKLEQQIVEGQNLLKEAEDDEAKQDALLEIAFAYEQLGHLDEAIEYYDQILAINPNHYQSNNNLGVIYEEVGEFEQAALSYGKNLNNYPDDLEALRDTLRALVEAKHFDDAQATLENFARANQNSEDETIVNLISDEFEKIRNAKMQYENENTAN